MFRAAVACFSQGVGGDSDWARVSEICERLGLLEDGGVREVRTATLPPCRKTGGEHSSCRSSWLCQTASAAVDQVPEEGVDETGWAEDVARAIAEDVLPGVWNGDRNNADVGTQPPATDVM